MPEKLPGDNPRWARKYVSPALDFILREELKDEIAARMVVGGDHPQKQKYPQHKFSGFGEADKGVQVAYFCKTRDAQEAYNYLHAHMMENEWPEVRQSWIITRAEHEANGLTEIMQPPALGSHVWTFVGAQQGRLPPELDGLFVEVIHRWLDIREPLQGEVIDLDTNTVQGTQRTIVPAGTAADPVGPNGTYSVITPINTLLSYKDIKMATGLAGRAVNGKAQRTLRIGDQWPLPSVLNYIAIFTVHTDPSEIYSPVSRYIVVPKLLVNGGAYPCKITIVEKWFSKEPILAESGGDPDWDSTKSTSPLLLMPVALLETPIDFNGVELFVNVAACLHGFHRFWDTGYSDAFPATNYTRWPATFLGRVQMRRENGGYSVQEWYITPPAEGRVTSLNLRQYGESTATTAVIEWDAAAGNPETRLDVATDPNYTGGWLEGYRNKLITPPANVPPLRHTITGLVRNRIYHCRVRRGDEVSEIVQITGAALPELTASIGGTPVLTAAVLNLGSVEAGGRITQALRLSSIGLVAVNGITAALTGDDAGLFSLGDLPNILTSGATADLELRFDPLAAGTVTCTLTVTSEAVDSPFVLTLSGTGTAAEIQVEQPAGSPVASGGTVAYGTVTTGSVSKTFKVRNVGNATLRGLAVSITGADAGDWTVTTVLSSDEIAAGAFQNIVVRFDPIESEDAFGARAAVLSIASNDADENPHLINLTGTSQSPTAPGTVDGMFDPEVNGTVKAIAMQSDGEIIIGGSFTSVNGTTRNRLARVNADGTLDAFDPNADDVVNCLAIQADGKVIVGGEFLNIVATARNRIARLNADGTLEAFNPNADGVVNCLAIQADGKVIVGGEFANIGGGAKSWLARLNADGTLDAGFTSEVSGPVYGVTINEAGKIVIVGDWPLPLSPAPTPSPTPTPGTTPPPSTPPPTASDSPSPPVPTPSTTSSNAPTPSTTSSDAMSPPPTPSTTSSDVMSPPPPTASDSPSPPPPTPSTTSSDAASPPPTPSTTSSDAMSPPPTASDSPSPP